MRKFAINILILTAIVIFMAGCSTNANDKTGNQPPNNESFDLSEISVRPTTPNLNADGYPKDSIMVEIVPEQKWRKELEQAMLAETTDLYDGKIYTRLRQIPESTRVTYDLFRDKLTIHKIRTTDWIGEIKESFDSDKLSYRLHSDTVVYYELARKLIVNVTNVKTGQNIKTEITRENVIKNSDEEYAQFNLYSWSIECIDSKKLQISQIIALLDSDIGDDILLTIYPKGNMSLKNISTLNNLGDD